ncbi:hypothetical protein AwWohl_11700 [Gammaproteobacteria bacterium]|nr:hypothetical protein AwWohl_11700 [Gammaproteobacteria bacterium]
MLRFLISLVADSFAFLLILRFILQIYKADYNHPLILLLVRATNPILSIARMVLPNKMKYDYACILAALCLFLIKYTLILLLIFKIISPLSLFLYIGLDTLKAVLNVYVYALIIYAITSWMRGNNRQQTFENYRSPYSLVLLIANSCLSKIKPLRFKNFDLRVLILVFVGFMLINICNNFILI